MDTKLQCLLGDAFGDAIDELETNQWQVYAGNIYHSQWQCWETGEITGDRQVGTAQLSEKQALVGHDLNRIAP